MGFVYSDNTSFTTSWCCWLAQPVLSTNHVRHAGVDSGVVVGVLWSLRMVNCVMVLRLVISFYKHYFRAGPMAQDLLVHFTSV